MLEWVSMWLARVFTAVSLHSEHQFIRNRNEPAHAAKLSRAGDIVLANGERRDFAIGDAFCVAPNLGHGAICHRASVLLHALKPARVGFLASGS